jgi:hypothetical protein
MAVVSDNWAGLEDGYRELGIEPSVRPTGRQGRA